MFNLHRVYDLLHLAWFFFKNWLKLNSHIIFISRCHACVYNLAEIALFSIFHIRSSIIAYSNTSQNFTRIESRTISDLLFHCTN